MSDTQPGHRLILVGGAARSGTTLVQNMLDCHPAILGGPEFLHLQDIVQLRKRLLSSVKKEWIDLYCSHEQIETQLAKLIHNLLLPLADRHNKTYLSEKTPENTLVFPQLAAMLPGARFIQIIRDPRAVVASMLAVGRRSKGKGVKSQEFTRSVGAAISYILKCYEAGARAAAFAPERVLTVTYEGLVSDPATVTREICAFLNLSWSEEMLSPGDKAHLGEKAITQKSNEIWYTKKEYYSNPNTGPIEKWKSTLTPFQLVMIQRGLADHPLLAAYDYQLSVDHLPSIKRATARMAAAGVHLLRGIRRRARIALGA